MTEITRVPLQPIARGALGKVWLGVAAIALAAGGIAWAAVPHGVNVDTVAEGTGPQIKVGDVAFVRYTGKLPDGTEFDKSRPLPLPPGLLPDGMPFLVEEGQVVEGFYEGLLKMSKGGKYTLNIPAAMGYGASPPPGSPIPPNTDLIFDIEVVEVMSKDEAEKRFQVAQQLMQQMQGPGAPGAEGAPEGALPAPGQP